jgi:hypothetical protein
MCFRFGLLFYLMLFVLYCVGVLLCLCFIVLGFYCVCALLCWGFLPPTEGVGCFYSDYIVFIDYFHIFLILYYVWYQDLLAYFKFLYFQTIFFCFSRVYYVDVRIIFWSAVFQD